eukprot:865348-Pyramimonas_sp.AAC.1
MHLVTADESHHMPKSSEGSTATTVNKRNTMQRKGEGKERSKKREDERREELTTPIPAPTERARSQREAKGKRNRPVVKKARTSTHEILKVRLKCAETTSGNNKVREQVIYANGTKC